MLALSESLRQEIEPLGLHCTCIEPGYFRTDFLAPGNRLTVSHAGFDDYESAREAAQKGAEGKYCFFSMSTFASLLTDGLCIDMDGKQIGDPKKAVEIIIDIVKSEGLAKGRQPPPFIGLGSDAYTIVKETCISTIERLDEWKDIITSTDLPKDN